MFRQFQAWTLLCLASIGIAQIPNIIPFTVTGGLDSCTAGTEFNAGGSIQVNGFNIKVPKNLIVQFPTVFAPFKELCGANAGGFETTVTGNIVGGTIIAGQVQVAQRFGLEGSQGYITAINSDGSLSISGGVTVRINDPDGLFGPKVETALMFVADTGSPSVTSFSGFPMCIPYSGNTDKCLSSNRPNGQTFSPPDPLRMVPLKVGDFIEYSGLKVGGSEMLVSDITCISLQITTQAGANVPNYIRVEDMLVGVPDTANNVEFADIRVIGFLSSCAGATVTISAIEVDACTGKETYRQISTATPRQETRCKWEARIAPQAQVPFTREYRITTNTPVKETKDGIQGGQFIAAVGEWIFPEVDVPGTNPPPYRFTDLRDLVQGTVLDGKQFGPLDPFPGPAPPAPSKTCSPSDLEDPDATPTPSSTPDDIPSSPGSPAVAPVAAAARIAATQRVGVNFLLVGSNTEIKLSANDLTFKWTQTSPTSPSASITNPNSASASVIAPKVSSETTFTFDLLVSLRSNSSISSRANVTVKVSPTLADTVVMDRYAWESRQSGTIDVACSSDVVNGDNKKMSLWLNDGNTKIDMTNNGVGKWVYQKNKVNRPTTLKCLRRMP
ncbi:hypothetical protein CC86DRAFT_418142 [Ophiobolus disseminans]|uniref:Uncharacterized protein n=1 Tax=Ophiobolus disseminans TaxID=1469910 RepID=A0A6A6ZZ16_9PLEO|nr:hypothetical protein CC86DRAFT_418142 [Ophiobolus disseminans]